MNEEKANRIPDAKGVINTVNTGSDVFCPNCGKFCLWHSGPNDLRDFTQNMEMNCHHCDIEFLVKFVVTVNFSTYKIKIT